MLYVSESRSVYSKIGGGSLQPPSPPQNPPAAKLASQGDAYVRNNSQIKFLYYPLDMDKLKHPKPLNLDGNLLQNWKSWKQDLFFLVTLRGK